MNIMERAAELIKNRTAFAFVTVISSKGSTPRSTAAKMLVLRDGSIFDTIGGGLVEARVIEEAVQALQQGKPRTLEYRLNSSAENGLNMLCGGDMDIFIDVYNINPHVVIVGGGHVGFALSKAVELLGWDFSIVEERPEFNSDDRFIKARRIYREGDVKALSEMKTDNNTYIVIVTKGHDKKALQEVVEKNAGYIGMIGSKRKVAVVKQELLQEGISKEALDRVYAPIGMDIGAETPEEIAISIAAEMLTVKNNGSGRSLSYRGDKLE